MDDSRKIKAVFFDLDGTLVDIREAFYESARYALAQLGIDKELTLEKYYELISKHGLSLGVPEAHQRRYAHLALGHYMQRLEAGLTPRVLPTVVETLTEIKRQRYITGVVTSRPGDPEVLAERLNSYGLRQFFDIILTSPFANLKALDKTDNLILATRLTGTPPSNCVYVTDEPRDVKAARRANFAACIAVTTGASGYDHLCAYPEAKADHIINSMDELLSVLRALQDGSFTTGFTP